MGQIEWPARRHPLARERVGANTKCLFSHASTRHANTITGTDNETHKTSAWRWAPGVEGGCCGGL